MAGDRGVQWPNPREGYEPSTSGTGYWCQRCAAKVHPNRVDDHDDFHDRVEPKPPLRIDPPPRH